MRCDVHCLRIKTSHLHRPAYRLTSCLNLSVRGGVEHIADITPARCPTQLRFQFGSWHLSGYKHRLFNRSVVWEAPRTAVPCFPSYAVAQPLCPVPCLLCCVLSAAANRPRWSRHLEAAALQRCGCFGLLQGSCRVKARRCLQHVGFSQQRSTSTFEKWNYSVACQSEKLLSCSCGGAGFNG